MRLRCPQCATEYDLRPPGGGRSLARIKFRCTNCGAQLTDSHLLTDSEPEPDSPDLPFAADTQASTPAPAAAEAARPTPQESSAEGALLKQEGKVYHVRSLATIQRWIVERRVLREDLISTGGGTWEPVGTHPDLDVFFHMVERLDELELGSRGLAEPHSTRPPLADETPVGNAWSDPDSWDGGPPDLGIDEPDEDPDSEPSDVVYAVREEDEDPDSDLSFEPRSPPLAPLEEDVLATEERAMSPAEIEQAFTDELPDFPDAPIDDAEPTLMDDPGGYVEAETEQQPEPAPALEPAPAPSNNSFFSDDKFFGPTVQAEPDPEPAPAPAPVDDRLEWEEDRTQAQMRLLAVAVVLLLLLGAGWWWWSAQQSAPVADADPATESADGVAAVDPPEEAGDPVEGDPTEADPTEADPAEADPPEPDPPEAQDPPDPEPEPVKPPPEPVKPPPAERTPPAERAPAKPPPPKAQDPWDLIQSGQIGDARLGFVEQISRNPRDAEAHFGLGYAAQRQGDTATAVRSYCKALELAPSDNDIQREATSLVNSLQGSCD